MSNPLPLLIVACGAVAVFGTLTVLVGVSILKDWKGAPLSTTTPSSEDSSSSDSPPTAP
jgi:hypothetical protein